MCRTQTHKMYINVYGDLILRKYLIQQQIYCVCVCVFSCNPSRAACAFPFRMYGAIRITNSAPLSQH